MAEHTPTPWRVEEDASLIWGECNPDDNSHRGFGIPVADALATGSRSWGRRISDDERMANAAFIVESCNNYARLREENAALVEALGIISMFPITHPMSNQDAANMQQIATAALAKSREGNGGNNG